MIGVLPGFFRRLDGPLMRFTDLFLALPVLPLLMVSTMPFRESHAPRSAWRRAHIQSCRVGVHLLRLRRANALGAALASCHESLR